MNNMFTSNPFENTDALWQHIVMILVSAIIGYIIGIIDIKQTTYRLERKLISLNAELETYMSRKARMHHDPLIHSTPLAEINSLNILIGSEPDDLGLVE